MSGFTEWDGDSIMVERRSEPRIAYDSPILLSVLGAEPHLPIPGRVVELSGTALKVGVQNHLAVGTLIKAEVFESLLLCEVCRSEQTADGFNVVLSVSHSLNLLSQLERLNAALLCRARENDPSSRERRGSSSRGAGERETVEQGVLVGKR